MYTIRYVQLCCIILSFRLLRCIPTDSLSPKTTQWATRGRMSGKRHAAVAAVTRTSRTRIVLWKYCMRMFSSCSNGLHLVKALPSLRTAVWRSATVTVWCDGADVAQKSCAGSCLLRDAQYQVLGTTVLLSCCTCGVCFVQYQVLGTAVV